MKILITDCLNRKAFDVFNITKKYFKISQIILGTNKWNKSIGNIIYLKSITCLGDTFNIFSQNMLKLYEKNKNEEIVYIPIEESTTLLFYKFIENYGYLNFKFLLPSLESFKISRNKYLLNEFCYKNDIPCPKYYDNLSKIPTGNNFTPIIVKPRIGSGAKGIIKILQPAELKVIENINTNNFLFQELLPNGKDVKGAFFLCNKGKVICSYCHERIRTFPLDGGVTVYSKIINNEKIIKIGSNLLSKLDWSGVAMIEFLWDENENTYKVIEINPRLWGSFLLSEFAGTQFFNNYINISLNKPIKQININWSSKIRWIPFDILNLIKSKKKITNIWKFNKKNTCFINVTYSGAWSLFWFHVFFYFNFKNFKTFAKKWKK